MVLHTKNQVSICLAVSVKNMFPYISLCKTCDHQGGPNFGPGAYFEPSFLWYIYFSDNSYFLQDCVLMLMTSTTETYF